MKIFKIIKINYKLTKYYFEQYDNITGTEVNRKPKCIRPKHQKKVIIIIRNKYNNLKRKIFKHQHYFYLLIKLVSEVCIEKDQMDIMYLMDITKKHQTFYLKK